MIRVLSYDYSGFIPDGCNQMLWHKCATSAECRTIRIAASADMDNWKGHTVSVIRIYTYVTSELELELER